ncbi:hypothetical protein L484_012812 [Morus notabilis]|uniref:Uncharacterized protein n=1 Tax=Morus notabilis TaxID=981085 RepID=W9QTV4_9ROSA|nr:hypothetical protein L484_012812 [Morus notabilis]
MSLELCTPGSSLQQLAASKQTVSMHMIIEKSYPVEIPNWYFPSHLYEDDDFLVTDEVMGMFPEPGYYLFEAPSALTDSLAPSTDKSSRDGTPDRESVAIIFHPSEEDQR